MPHPDRRSPLRTSLLLRWVLLAGLLLSPTTALAQTGITFSFANVQMTDAGLAFDVMVQAAEAGTRLGDTQVYLNYNPDAFGPSVVTKGRITVSPGEAFAGRAAYRPPIINDNTAARVSITTEFVGKQADGVPLPATAVQLLRVVLAFVDESQPPDLRFDTKLMTGQQFESDYATVYLVRAGVFDDGGLKHEQRR